MEIFLFSDFMRLKSKMFILLSFLKCGDECLENRLEPIPFKRLEIFLKSPRVVSDQRTGQRPIGILGKVSGGLRQKRQCHFPAHSKSCFQLLKELLPKQDREVAAENAKRVVEGLVLDGNVKRLVRQIGK